MAIKRWFLDMDAYNLLISQKILLLLQSPLQRMRFGTARLSKLKIKKQHANIYPGA
jgi:hypothetical protein